MTQAVCPLRSRILLTYDDPERSNAESAIGKMTDHKTTELKRRSLLKALVWRIIGVLWTWVGAYIILSLVPPSHRSAALIATLIVVYHHSTRMVMYYAYERIWASVSWGRDIPARPMSRKEKIVWTGATAVALCLIFFLLVAVTPKIKAEQCADKPVRATTDSVRSAPAVAPRR